MGILDTLDAIASTAGPRRTRGLPRDVVLRFAELDPQLGQAVEDAAAVHARLRQETPELLALAEEELIASMQDGIVNFYPEGSISPYVPLAGRGPWLITHSGAVVHDSGGYGMLGFGHSPPTVQRALSRSYVMANVMTASFCQGRFVGALRRELGHSRADGCPFDGFVCLNSGSEAMTLAARISDINALLATGSGGPQEGRAVRQLVLRGSFHGRTTRPARLSDSTLPKYRRYLRSFQGESTLVTVPINDLGALRAAFAQAESDGAWFESFFFEPVQGEGNPGVAVTPEFYSLARELTAASGTLLVADSIQAGLRAWGVLSIVDYPGFEGLPAPDIESYSKALNAGQFPLSVLAMRGPTAALYRKGLYGNTMTTNPRALAVAGAVLELLTPELRANIVQRGEQLRAGLRSVSDEVGPAARAVTGTGLLCALELDPEVFTVEGFGGIEAELRLRGLNVIHGGKNALRFTPWFGVTAAEIDLLVGMVREVLLERRA